MAYRMFNHGQETSWRADIISGALTYKKRALNTSQAKLDLISHIEKEFSLNLNQTTTLKKLDFNLLVWTDRTI